jgi:signal peptidase II
VSPATARAWRLATALGGLIVGLDQGAKALVEANLYPGERVDVLGPLSLTLSYNDGVAFGLGGGGGDLLVFLTGGALLAIAAMFARAASRPGLWVAFGLLLGGALGNLADRVRAGAVTDYVDVLSWPAFNLADVAITVGVGLLVVIQLRQPQGSGRG